MIHRLVGRSLLFSVALALAACGGGGGGGGGAVPPGATPTPTPGGATQSFSATTSGPSTVGVLGPIGGISASIQIPPLCTDTTQGCYTANSGTGSITLTTSPPGGTPAVSSAARRPKNIGGALTPLAYFTITASSNLSFEQTPAISLTVPSASSTYVYVGFYSGATNGWIAVAGPGTLVGGKYVINPTDDNFAVAAGQTGVFALFGSSSLVNVNPPGSPVSDECSADSYRRIANGSRLAPRAVSHVVPNRLYVSYGGGASSQSIARSVGAVHSIDLTATKGVAHTVVTLPAGTSLTAAAATLRAQSGVVSVSQVHTRTILSDSEANDTLLDNVDQWYLYRTNTDPGGWNLTHGTGIVVAVIDTGVDMTNQDLTPKLNKAESIVDGMITTSAQDTNGHGTNVAGLVAATTNNTYGYASVGWDVHLLDYKIFADSNAFSDCQTADTTDEAAAIDDAVSTGASVISLSLGSPNDNGGGADSAEQDAVEAAISAGVTVVAAAGNEFGTPGAGTAPDYPAAYSGVIAVGASAVFDSTMNDYNAITSETVAQYSNSGPTLLAPGGDSLSDPPTNCENSTNPCDTLHWIEGYSTTSAGLPSDRCSGGLPGGVCAALFNGTSQATPQVAATVALMEAIHGGARSLTPAQAKTILQANSDPLPGLSTAREGAGRLDVAKAVAAAK